jgi:hypothetical protein
VSGINFPWMWGKGKFGYIVYIALILFSVQRRKCLVREGLRLLLFPTGPHSLPLFPPWVNLPMGSLALYMEKIQGQGPRVHKGEEGN